MAEVPTAHVLGRCPYPPLQRPAPQGWRVRLRRRPPFRTVGWARGFEPQAQRLAPMPGQSVLLRLFTKPANVVREVAGGGSAESGPGVSTGCSRGTAAQPVRAPGVLRRAGPGRERIGPTPRLQTRTSAAGRSTPPPAASRGAHYPEERHSLRSPEAPAIRATLSERTAVLRTGLTVTLRRIARTCRASRPTHATVAPRRSIPR